MIKLLSTCLLLFVPAIIGQSGKTNAGGSYAGPHALGPYSVDRDTSMKSLLAVLGSKPSGKETYCFADREHGIYLYARPMHDGSARVAEVLLSSFPNCSGLAVQPTTIDPATWKLPDGIGIGSTKDEVLRAYGKPVLVSELEKKSDLGVVAGIQEAGTSKVSVGDSSFLYNCSPSEASACSDDNRAAQIGFRDGKLVWVRLSNSE